MKECIPEEAIFAKSLIDIDDHKIRMIKHRRKSLLFHDNLVEGVVQKYAN